MKIVTIANARPTAPYYMYDEFFASCRRFGHEPIVLSEGWGGLGTKPLMLRAAIEAGKIEDEQMIFCDCFDVLFQSDPARALETYHFRPAMAEILWNAEKTCFPEPRLAQFHPETTSPFKYLNSGFAIGYTKAFLQAIDDMEIKGWGQLEANRKFADGGWSNPNDQVMWQRQFLFGAVSMALDFDCELCQTTHGVTPEELDFSGPLIRNTVTNTTPVAFHLNGQKETYRDRIIRHLGLG